MGEGTQSFLARAAFLWLLPLMWRGRTERLTLESLGAVPLEDRAKHSRAPLVEALHVLNSTSSSSSDKNAPPAKAKRSSKHMLLRATLKAYKLEMLMPILPRLILLAATFCQPFLVERMVNYVQNPTKATTQEGWYLVAGFVCVFGQVVHLMRLSYSIS